MKLAAALAAGAIAASAVPALAFGKVEKSETTLTCDGTTYTVYVSTKTNNKGTYETRTYLTADGDQYAGQEQFANTEVVYDTFEPNDDGCL
jgi:spore coat protein U-like protein